MLLQALGALSVVAIAGLLIWAAMRSARQAGAATEQAKEAKDVAKTAERVADATAGAPRTADDLVDRVRGGKPL